MVVQKCPRATKKNVPVINGGIFSVSSVSTRFPPCFQPINADPALWRAPPDAGLSQRPSTSSQNRRHARCILRPFRVLLEFRFATCVPLKALKKLSGSANEFLPTLDEQNQGPRHRIVLY